MSRTYISKTDVENFKQVTVVRTFVCKDYEAHNARADVKALRELSEMKLLVLCSAYDMFTRNHCTVKKSLEPFVKANVLSCMIIMKLVANSLG